MKPTEKIYSYCQSAFDHFNNKLFDGKLSDVIITFQRKNNTFGYFSYNRWIEKNDNKKHEIALNPDYFATKNPLEFFQTLIHEMCHQWQFEYGKPSMKVYHNKEWAEKMESIGLMPSNTGEVGGKKTGQHMGDYLIPRGKAILEICSFVRDNRMRFIPYMDRVTTKYTVKSSDYDEITALIGSDNITEGDNLNELASLLLRPIEYLFTDIEIGSTSTHKKNKVTYICGCEYGKNKLWGAAGKKIKCMTCGHMFNEKA